MSLRGRVGVACLVLGLVGTVAMLSSFPALLVGGCTDVGVPEDHDGSVAIRGVDDGAIVYTPDGVNECSAPLAYVGVPPSLAAIGGVLVAPSLRE